MQPQLGEIAIEASQIVSRLEQIAVGGSANDGVFNQPTVFLGLDQKQGNEIIQTIQTLVATDEDGEPTALPALDDIAKLVITSHSLAAYCGNLDRMVLQKLSTRFTTDTTRWLSQMFGYVNNNHACKAVI